MFPGTNCEYDSMRAFERAGAEVEIMVLNNLSSRHIEESIKVIAEKIRNSQILCFQVDLVLVMNQMVLVNL